MNRSVTCACVALIALVTGCGSQEPDGTTAATKNLAVQMLVDQPALPSTWRMLIGRGEFGERQRIEWRLMARAKRTGPGVSADCGSGGVEFVRIWRDRGEEFREPAVLHFVCVYPSAAVADDAFDGKPLKDALGWDYPNFERGPASDIRPSDETPLGTLRADEYTVACVAGPADGICGVWIFRARYGAATTRLMLRTSGGGTEFGPFAELVRSVDRKMAAR